MDFTNHLTKARSIAVSVAAVILSVGAWSDTEAVIISAYQRIEANFTNENEYNLINQVNVGHSFQYLSSLIGVSQAVKSSKLDKAVQFHYFHDEKFLLSVAVKQGRVASYAVQSLIRDFNVSIPFNTNELNFQPISSVISLPDNSHFESGNANFYLDAIALGRDAMYNTLMVGSYQYAPLNTKLAKQISTLDEEFVLGNDEAAESLKTSIRNQPADTFIIGELPEEILIEMLLSKYEFNSYFS